MRKWDVLFTATKISKGLELDFFDALETDDKPAAPLSKYDVLNFDVVSRRSKFQGSVLEIRDDGEAIIEAQGSRWRISPPRDSETVHPVRTQMRAHIWMVREELQ
jgi:hypothetical protein